MRRRKTCNISFAEVADLEFKAKPGVEFQELRLVYQDKGRSRGGPTENLTARAVSPSKSHVGLLLEQNFTF